MLSKEIGYKPKTMKPQQLITAEVMPDGTVKEVNPMGSEPDIKDYFDPNPDLSYKADDIAFEKDWKKWKKREQNRKVWPAILETKISDLNKEFDAEDLKPGQHVTGYISDGKFAITDINH